MQTKLKRTRLAAKPASCYSPQERSCSWGVLNVWSIMSGSWLLSGWVSVQCWIFILHILFFTGWVCALIFVFFAHGFDWPVLLWWWCITWIERFSLAVCIHITMFCKDMALCVCFYAPCVPRLSFNPAFNSVVLLSDFGSFTSPVLSGLFRLCFAWTYLLLVSLVKSSCLACYLRFGFFFCLFCFQPCCQYSGPGPFLLFNKDWLCPPHQTKLDLVIFICWCFI